jgi:hypothetical protein
MIIGTKIKIKPQHVLAFLLFTLFCFISTKHVYSAEADSFTRRDIPDATVQLNAMMNAELNSVAQSTAGCEAQQLYDLIVARLGGFATSKIERWGFQVPHDHRYYNESIKSA